jgi:hypothetical protein
VCGLSLCSPRRSLHVASGEFVTSKLILLALWKMTQIHALTPVTGGDAETTYHHTDILYLLCREEREIITALSLYTRSLGNVLLSPSPHLLTSTPSPHVVRLSRHAYAAARSGNATTDLARRLGNLSLVSSCTCALIYISPRGTGSKSPHVSCLLIALFGAAIVGQSKSAVLLI